MTVTAASGGTATTRFSIIILPSPFMSGFGGSNESSDAGGFDDAMAALTDGPDADQSLLEVATQPMAPPDRRSRRTLREHADTPR
jgi:hypothetical protein